MAVLLENALSEELPSPPHPHQQQPTTPPPPPLDHDRISPSSASPPPPATDKDKMLAACVGAVLTSLTMTPFDVIKTRLQTAPSPAHASHPSAFTAPPPPAAPLSHHLPTSHPYSHPVHTPYPPPVASTSTAPPPSSTFFAHNSSPAPAAASTPSSLWSRFDPRVARSSLPASGAHGALSSCSSTAAALHFPSSSHPAPSPSSLHVLYPPPPSRPPAPPPRQAQATSFLPLLRQILSQEGPSTLWRGTAPALLMSVPGQVIYMLGYDWGRRTAFLNAPTWARKGEREGEGGGELKAGYVTAVPLVAGAASRTVVAALLSPFELIRTQLQSHSSHSSSSTSPASLRRLLSELHWSTAWRGLGPTLWRDVPFSAVYWAGYEGLKRGLTGGRGMGEPAVGGHVPAAAGGGKVGGGGGREKLSVAERAGLGEFGVAFVSGAGSGMIAATLTNPFDVIKTRRQALSTSPSPSPASPVPSSSSSTSAVRASPPPPSTATLAILKQITVEEGVKGWFRGLTPRLAKVGPACGLMIGCYEALSSFSSASRAKKGATSAGSSSNAE